MSEELVFYIYAFMYELEEQLNLNSNLFENVSFQSDEANTDKELKIVIKNFILSNLTSLKKIKSINSNSNTVHVINARIKDVLCSDEISGPIKLYLESKSRTRGRVYKSPDLLLVIEFNDIDYYQAVEVKSTKDDKIPGSSVQQANPEDPVVFVRHKNGMIEVSTGLYMNAITDTMQFPDRSPRPQVGYKNLKDWNNNFRFISDDLLEFRYDENRANKTRLFDDWQQVLCDRWIAMLNSNAKNTNEPWFNTNMRKFVLQLLEQYDQLSDKEKLDFKDKINNQLSKNDN